MARTRRDGSKPYTLYWRTALDNGPTRKATDAEIASWANVKNKPRWAIERTHRVSVLGHGRGGILGTYARYKDLVADAQRRAAAAGVPKTRWMDIFDWNL